VQVRLKERHSASLLDEDVARSRLGDIKTGVWIQTGFLLLRLIQDT